MKRCLTLLVLVAACGDVKPSEPPKRSLEVTSGGGRLTSATYTFEVQVGHPLGQATVRGSTFTLDGNAAVRP
jgi:hypothetical protein